ncbi:MAG: KOW domain-containing RNA-binding protein [Clostridia bacterium]|nr:KOW domain-containing RNA-binding protein [Clostridia bacterium]
MDKPIEIGTICYSRAGRDSKRYYIIVGIENSQYVYISDGKYHKLSKPKKKNICHLRVTEYKLDVIAEKIKNGQKIYDAELNRALRTFN